MKAIEMLKIFSGAFKLMSDSGVKIDDFKYIRLYEDYSRLRGSGEKYWYCISLLASKYGISESSVIRVIRRLGRECQEVISDNND